MIALPSGARADDLERLADWAEASALVVGPVSRDDVMRVGAASSLVNVDEDFDSDGTEADAGEGNTDDALERLAEDVLAVCDGRRKTYGDGYPFRSEADVLELRDDVEHDAYAFLLVADLGHHYPALKDAIKPDTKAGRLLEKVVEASLRGLFGTAQRFGWPREPGWPTSIDDRVVRLGGALGRSADSPASKTDPADKDRSLDVVALVDLPGGPAGGLVLLTQCAAGENWKSKTGEPSLAAWENLMLWESQLARCVAVPWRLGGRSSDWSYRRAWSMFNAMILDRPRLLAGVPDLHLDAAVRADVRLWWTGAADLVPRLT